MIVEMKNQGATIAYVVPPLYEPYYLENKPGFDQYKKVIVAALPPAPVIDFLSPEYTALRSDPDNFVDNEHEEPAGAAKFRDILVRMFP